LEGTPKMVDKPEDDKSKKPELPPTGWLSGNTSQPQPRQINMVAASGGFSFEFAEAALTIHKPLPEDHQFYAIVGRVASEWSHLEHILDLTIWELTGLRPEVAACITSQILGVNPRCKAIQMLLLTERLDADRSISKAYRSLSSESFNAADWRARFVHDPWYLKVSPSGAETPTQFRAMPFVDPRYGFCEITTEEIDKTITKIKDLQSTANALHERVLSVLHGKARQ
jgi:hypothetical protein